MIIRKPLLDECLQCVKEPTNEVVKNAVAVLWCVLILNVNMRWLAMCNRNLHDCINVSIPVPLRFGHLCYWETRQPWR